MSSDLPKEIRVWIENPTAYLGGSSPKPLPVGLSRPVRDDPRRSGAVLNANHWRVEHGRRTEIHPRDVRRGDYVLTGPDQLQEALGMQPGDGEWRVTLDTTRAHTFADLDAMVAQAE
jgi:hypothetical protein